MRATLPQPTRGALHGRVGVPTVAARPLKVPAPLRSMPSSLSATSRGLLQSRPRPLLQHTASISRRGAALTAHAKKKSGFDGSSFDKEEAREAAIEKLKQPSTWLILGIGGVVTVSALGTIGMMILGPGIIVASTFAASGMAIAALSLFSLVAFLPLISTVLFGAFGASALLVGSIGAVLVQTATVLLGLGFGVWIVGKVFGGGEMEEAVPETPEEKAARELREEREADVKRIKDERAQQAQELKDFDRRLAAGSSGAGVTMEEIREWSVDEVGAWLTSVGLGHFSATFTLNDIDGGVLLSLDESDLEADLGMQSLGERRKVMEALRKAKEPV